VSKIAKKYLGFEVYEKSEVDTISGSLSDEIDGDISTHTTADAHHYKKHDIDGGDDHNNVEGVVEGNFVSWDQDDGYPVEDSGYSASDFSASGHDHDSSYYTETELNSGQLDNRYYTETEVDTISGSLSAEIDSDIVTFSGTIDHNTINNYEVGEHRTIDDNSTGSTDLWSAEKIDSEIATVSGLLDEHNELKNIQGGTTDEYYHLTANEEAKINAGANDLTLGDGSNKVVVDLGGDRVYIVTDGGTALDVNADTQYYMMGEPAHSAIEINAGDEDNVELVADGNVILSADSTKVDITTDLTRSGTVDGVDIATLSGTIDHNTIVNTHNLSTDISHNGLSDLQGGDTGEFYHLNAHEDLLISATGDTYMTIGGTDANVVIDTSDDCVQMGDTNNLDTYLSVDMDGQTIKLKADADINLDALDDIYLKIGSTIMFRVDGTGVQLKTGGVIVDEIIDSADTITDASTDLQLATAKLIYDTISGTVGGLTGGTPDRMYYVGADGSPATTSLMTFDPATGDIKLFPNGSHGLYMTGAGVYYIGDYTTGTNIKVDDGNNKVTIRPEPGVQLILDGPTELFDLNLSTGNTLDIDGTNEFFDLDLGGVDVFDVTISGISLEAGPKVNEILDSNDTISSASTDRQLSTAKLIYDYADTISGTIDHDTILNGHNLTSDIDHDQLTNYAIGQHRVINDGGTGSTDLWSAEKLDSHLDDFTDHESESNPHGTGLDDIDNVTISSEADDEVLAYDNGTSEWINQTPLEAGLATPADIATFSGTIDHDTINNTHNLTTDITGAVEAAGLTLDSTKVIDSADEDLLFNFGKAFVGYMGSANAAGFGHRDFVSTTGFGFRQESAGATSINAPSGEIIAFRINGNLKFRVEETSGLHLDTLVQGVADYDQFIVANSGNANQLMYRTGAEVLSDIGADNYDYWTFAVDGVSKDNITSGDVFDIVGGDNITVTRTAEDQITISGTAGGGSANHSELNELDYASAGHTGFTSSTVFNDHSARHENGGDDEISVAALSGLLADDQHVLDAEAVAAVEAAGLTLASTKVIDSADEDIYHLLGRSYVGYCGHGDYAAFGHRDARTTGKYALRQNSAGTVTDVNATIAGRVSLKVNHSDIAYFESTGTYLPVLSAGAADYDKFLVSDGGLVKYRTGAQMLGDLNVEDGATADQNKADIDALGVNATYAA